jgi:protein deglycase
MTRALVPLANGVEEIEAVIIIDTLRRAKWEVVSVGIGRMLITASRHVELVADLEWHNIRPATFDVMVIPGGADGTKVLCSNEHVLEAIRHHVRADKLIGAVCAGPLVLQAAGVLDGRKATCHPGVADQLTVTRRLEQRVVIDGKIVTSQGPGTCFEFALTLISLVDGKKAADTVAKAMVI